MEGDINLRLPILGKYKFKLWKVNVQVFAEERGLAATLAAELLVAGPSEAKK